MIQIILEPETFEYDAYISACCDCRVGDADQKGY